MRAVVTTVLSGCLLLSTGVGRAANPEDPPVFLLKWGSSGSGDGQGNFWSAATNPSGDVYVTDHQNHRIQKFDGDGTFLLKWGGPGTGDGQFDQGPSGLAVDASGIVYVASDARVQKFTADGLFMGTFDAFVAYIDVDQAGQFAYGVAGTLVFQYANDGTFIRSWVTPSGTGGGVSLRGVAVGPSGNVYVVDGGEAERVYKYTADGVLLGQWGDYGTGDGQFRLANGVAVDSDENVYVCEGTGNRVQKFTSTGMFLTKWGSEGSGDGEFIYPTDLAVDADGNIYVVDSANNRIQKFGFPSTPTRTTTWGRIKAMYRGSSGAGR